ncbi:MAG TPA: NAD(P)-dependent oxidoreductase [Candidatus Dormibacteraeota bacterium]|nr:NAD(P)-dependent oxidoreductase [Candidatus Dormibacteraeota bacterium]
MADPIVRAGWKYDIEREILAERDVHIRIAKDEEEAHEIAPIADIVVVTSRFLDRASIASLRRCVGIVCYSVGMDRVDLEAAAAARIPVANVPGYCTDEVSDHAMTLLLALERRLLPLAGQANAGVWFDQTYMLPIRRLRGQTLGILGAGRIGGLVATKAQAFGFRTIAYDPFLSESGVTGLDLVPLYTLLGESDAVVVCAKLDESTHNLVSADFLERMREGSFLINVARGGLVDEAALAAALRGGHLAGAALDVRAQEPPPNPDPLAGIPNLLLTPHAGAASREAWDDLHRGAAMAALDLLERAGRISR